MDWTRWVLGLVGLGIVGYVVFDVVWTTLTLNGAGPLTAAVSRWVWRTGLRIRRSHLRHRALPRAALFIVLSVLILWTLLLWTGWTLVFLIDPQASWTRGPVAPQMSGK